MDAGIRIFRRQILNRTDHAAIKEVRDGQPDDIASGLIPMFAGFLSRCPSLTCPLGQGAVCIGACPGCCRSYASLSRVEDFGSRLDDMALTVLRLFARTVGKNLLTLAAAEKKLFPWRIKGKGKDVSVDVSGSVGQLGCVLLDLHSGKPMRDIWMPPGKRGHVLSDTAGVLIGVQPRWAISLRQVLVNRRGIRLSVRFMLSSLSGGLLFAASTDGVSWTKGLAMASGLVGIPLGFGRDRGLRRGMGQHHAAERFGTSCLHWHLSAADEAFSGCGGGVGGATSMDFTLPVIQGAGGLEVVPEAVSFGVVVNIAAPFLMVVFTRGLNTVKSASRCKEAENDETENTNARRDLKLCPLGISLCRRTSWQPHWRYPADDTPRHPEMEEAGSLKRHHGGASSAETCRGLPADRQTQVKTKTPLPGWLAEHNPDGPSLFVSIGTTMEAPAVGDGQTARQPEGDYQQHPTPDSITAARTGLYGHYHFSESSVLDDGDG